MGPESNDWILIRRGRGTTLVVQWLRLHAANAGGLDSIPGQGTRSHILKLRVRMPQLDFTGHNKDRRSGMPQLSPSAAK